MNHVGIINYRYPPLIIFSYLLICLLRIDISSFLFIVWIQLIVYFHQGVVSLTHSPIFINFLVVSGSEFNYGHPN